VNVVSVDSLLLSGRNEDVTFEFHELRGVQVGFSGCSVETLKSSTGVPPALDCVNVHTGGVVDSGIMLNNTDNLGAILLQKFSSPVSDSAESLNNDGFTGNTLGGEE